MKSKGSKKKRRVGHGDAGPKVVQASDSLEDTPRGWIHPRGKFYSTDHHWEAITGYLRRAGAKDPEKGERNAHHAYTLGWISVGHGGATNAIGHKDVLESADHPAVQTLRKLVTKIPHFSLRVEKQMGELDPETGKHEDFDVSEYDLVFFIKRGRLRRLS